MIFKKITLCGIKTFIGEFEFNFPDKSGLYFMHGINKVDPKLGSNASGKSSFWDGLCWVLFGKTARGLRSGSVKSWGKEKDFYGILEFFIGDDFYVLKRELSPNSLTLNGDVLDQEGLEKVIKITYETFLYSILFGQFNDYFFKLKPTDKLKLFTDLMSLDIWIDRSKKASELHKKLLIKGSDTENKKSFIEGNKIKSLELLNKHKKLLKQWKKDSKIKIRDKKILKKSLKKDLNSLDNKLEKLLNEKELLKEDLSLVSNSLQIETQSLGKYKDDLDRVMKDKGVFLGKKEVMKEDYHFFRKFKIRGNGICDRCKQTVKKDHLKNMLENLKKKLRMVGVDLQPVLDKELKLESKIKKCSKALIDLNGDIRSLNKSIYDLNYSIDKCLMDLKNKNDSIYDLKIQIEKLKKESNPYKETVKSLKSDLVTLNKNMGLLDRLINYLNRDINFSKFWVSGFKELRLFLVSELLLQFELEANNYINLLGLEDWKITFDIETETKSKTIKKEFSVFVKSPSNKEKVLWESWSGGESQRLLLGGSMGLSNLILNRLGINSNIEIWDEPSKHLSKEGVLDLMRVLKTRSMQEDKQIWIVDHEFLQFGDFDNFFTVIRDEDGSRIE